MRIGVGSNAINAGTIDDVVAEARRAQEAGMSALWVSQIFGHDALTAIAVAGREVPDIELGTAVVPTYPRHPMMLAQQALTTQAATGGRLCLGIGLSHKVVVEGMWGLSYDHPARHMREYLEVLMPLLDGHPVQVDGTEYQVHGTITVAGASRPSVVVAALGPKMLGLAGSLTDGTSTWCTGVATLGDYIVPTINEAAAAAGRPTPRVVAGLPVCVTNDPDGARARAATVFAVYAQLPSYRAMMDREGVEDAAGLAIVGSEEHVREQIEAVAAAGVTDFNAAVFAANPDETDRTAALLTQMAAR